MHTTMSNEGAARERRIGALVFGAAAALVALSTAWRANVLWFVHPPAAWPRVVDVSHHQGEISWARVARDGVAGAWIKASEGGDRQDERFAANRDGARAAGLAWGAYHFFTFCADPAVQAENFLGVLGGDAGTLPPAVDVETGGNCAAVPAPPALLAALDTFLAAVEAATGRPTLLYVTADQLGPLFGGSPPARPLWVRSLFATPDVPGAAVAVWQFHSRGWVDGVSRGVDLDAVDPAAFTAWTRAAAR
jgi:lysozyme